MKLALKRRRTTKEEDDDEPSKKRVKQESEDSSSDEEYVLIFSLIGTVTHGSKDWLIYIGASKHMTGFKESFVSLSEHESPRKVKLGDDYQYPIKGSGESSYKLDFGKYMTMKDVLFVSGLKKNLLSISALDAKGMRVAFIDGQVIMWPKGKTINDVVVIGEQEGGLYKLKGQPNQALVHDTIEPNELWHRRLHMYIIEHYHLQAKLLKVFKKYKQNMKGSAKDVLKERIQRRHFQEIKVKQKESWKSSTPMYADQCHQNH